MFRRGLPDGTSQERMVTARRALVPHRVGHEREPERPQVRLTAVRRAWWTLLGTLLGLTAWAAPARAGAQQDTGRVSITASVGLDGKIGIARAYPVVVEVSSPSLLAGTLRVTASTD